MYTRVSSYLYYNEASLMMSTASENSENHSTTHSLTHSVFDVVPFKIFPGSSVETFVDYCHKSKSISNNFEMVDLVVNVQGFISQLVVLYFR